MSLLSELAAGIRVQVRVVLHVGDEHSKLQSVFIFHSLLVGPCACVILWYFYTVPAICESVMIFQ